MRIIFGSRHPREGEDPAFEFLINILEAGMRQPSGSSPSRG